MHLLGEPILIILVRSIGGRVDPNPLGKIRSEEHTSELQSLMRISYAVICLKKKTLRASKQKMYVDNLTQTLADLIGNRHAKNNLKDTGNKYSYITRTYVVSVDIIKKIKRYNI